MLNRTVAYALSALATTVAGLATAATAHAADGKIFNIQAVGPSDRPLVVASSDRGIVLIGPDHKVFRAYHHQERARAGFNQTYLWIADIDDDRRPEFVGAGSPSFVVDDNGDPMWGIANGCDQFWVGDFVQNGQLEMFCRKDRKMTVSTFDGQEVYAWEGRGFNIATCYADDFDSDRLQEVQCNLSGNKMLIFDVDGGAEPTQRDGQVEDPQESDGVDRTAGASLVDGSTPIPSPAGEFVIRTGEGQAQITRGGTMLGSVPITGQLFSAAVADLDKDGKFEVYLGGTDVVYVVDADGKLAATLPANPDRARREARVTLRSATANGLQNSDRDAIRATVEGGIGTIRQCYADRMGRDQFTRIGTMIWELKVNAQGTATDATKRHSELANRDLETCVGNALKRIKFTPATSAQALVTVTLAFDFTDAL